MTGSEMTAEATTSETSEKATPGESTGTESDASGSSQGEQDQAGGSRESTEGGLENGNGARQRGPTKLDTIRELRSKLRESNQRYGSEIESLKSQLEEFKAMLQSGQNGKSPRKTFWEAPEEVMDERLSNMEKRLLETFQQRETMNQQTSEWHSETSKAAELIRTQKGLTAEDEADIEEIVRSTPEMENLRPLQRARYALYLWKESKGIAQDKSSLKAKAAGIVGAPPPAGGPRTWTESEMDAELNKFPKDPKVWTPEQNKAFEALDLEFRTAFRENRVRK